MQVLSSLSSIPFYAPSAGFAPTNSADVSAIASAYQVVSATATQLNAGTAYLTSVNEAPISAARAGNAANASMANSAYYDGTGRLISALPDSATVSAIASAYAESAASGKLDKTAQVVTSIGTGWNSDDDEIVSAVNGCLLSADEARFAGAADGSNYARYDRRPNVTGYRSISSLPGSAEVSAIASSYAESAASSKLDATASSQFLTAIPSDYATTSYVDSSISGFAYESAVSGWTAKQDALTYGYNAANQISSIDGSALGGMDEAAVSGIASAYAESAVSSVSGNYYTTANESGFLTAQAQASWSESASASPSYIQDKPDLVDIVAGPGIVVDNPDGNTLRVSMAADYEVELLSSPLTTPANTEASTTLAETVSNFEYVAIYGYTDDGASYPFSIRMAVPQGVSGDITWSCAATNNGYVKFVLGKVNGTSLTLRKVKALQWGGGWADPGGTWGVTKVVGINRTASAQ